MSQEPIYPADAVPGRVSDPIARAKAALDPSPAIGATEVTPPAPAATDASKARRWQAGVAIGIGSAAVAAALIYASRPKRD